MFSRVRVASSDRGREKKCPLSCHDAPRHRGDRGRGISLVHARPPAYPARPARVVASYGCRTSGLPRIIQRVERHHARRRFLFTDVRRVPAGGLRSSADLGVSSRASRPHPRRLGTGDRNGLGASDNRYTRADPRSPGGAILGSRPRAIGGRRPVGDGGAQPLRSRGRARSALDRLGHGGCFPAWDAMGAGFPRADVLRVSGGRGRARSW